MKQFFLWKMPNFEKNGKIFFKNCKIFKKNILNTIPIYFSKKANILNKTKNIFLNKMSYSIYNIVVQTNLSELLSEGSVMLYRIIEAIEGGILKRCIHLLWFFISFAAQHHFIFFWSFLLYYYMDVLCHSLLRVWFRLIDWNFP